MTLYTTLYYIASYDMTWHKWHGMTLHYTTLYTRVDYRCHMPRQQMWRRLHFTAMSVSPAYSVQYNTIHTMSSFQRSEVHTNEHSWRWATMSEGHARGPYTQQLPGGLEPVPYVLQGKCYNTSATVPYLRDCPTFSESFARLVLLLLCTTLDQTLLRIR